ncbi:hypothetical protein F4861DRAFT_531651 [Xylaria intraflava]|nr:hypothetical protein F4861DRAFT_531651 [Xylaria intraflava]
MASMSTAWSQPTQPQVSQLFQFTYPTSVENVFPLPNGGLLLSTSNTSNLYYANPEATYPAAQNVITLPDSTALSGITELGDGLYAVAGRNNGSVQLHVVSVATDAALKATLDHSINVTNASSLDGLVSLPDQPRIVLAADSIKGRIMRIDTSNNTVTVALDSEALLPNAWTGRGVSGLGIHADYLYFTNAGTFARYAIDKYGNISGDLEIMGQANRVEASNAVFHDFTFDTEGNIFLAVYPSSIQTFANGLHSLYFGGPDSPLLSPTSIAMGLDGKYMYVSTGGKDTGYPISGGQLMRVQHNV